MSELHPAWKEAFLHPKQAQGIVVQLAESHPELEPEEWIAPAFPPAPEPAPRARRRARRAAARARARRRRGASGRSCSAGSATPSRHDLVFRWPDSPLAITVEIDAARLPGPLGIEIATPRALRFADGGRARARHALAAASRAPAG